MLERGFSFQSRKLSLLEADAIWPNDYVFLNWYFNWIARLLKFPVSPRYIPQILSLTIMSAASSKGAKRYIKR